MGWNNLEVSCGFGGGEETTRFGPRQEIGSNLYQVDTVACVSNNDSSFGAPKILCRASSTYVAVVVEKNLLVFNETFSEHVWTCSTTSSIDNVAWSHDGKFIVFANRCGSLSFGHVDSKQVLFEKNLLENEEKSRKYFVSIEFFQNSNGLHELVVITRDGLGFRFQTLDLANLSLAVDKRDLEEAHKIQANITECTFDVAETHDEVLSASYNHDSTGISLLLTGSGANGMSEWALCEDSVALIEILQHLDPECGFKKCLTTPDDQYIVTLDAKKRLSLWSRLGLIYLATWDVSQVEDFNLFITNSVDSQNNGNSAAIEESKVVLLTSPGKDKKRELVVLSLPNFMHVYTLKLSNCVALAQLPPNQETIVFLEGVDVEDDDLDESFDDMLEVSGNIKSIRIRCLMEAIPENRFSRLLHKKKFDEAEEFAKMFGLDVQLVHKVRSHNILDRLSPWGTDTHPSEKEFENLIEELKTCLDKIEDMEHVVNCCLRAQLPTLNATSDLLNYARQKVNFGERKFTKSSYLLQELLDGINRLITFEVAYGNHLFTGSAWNTFLTTPLIDEVIKSFGETKINSAIIIWGRHQSEFESQINLEKLQQILSSIPKIAPSKKLIPWLREDFVPYVLRVIPDGQCLLADWLENTARRLEFSEKENWPDNALELAEVMYTAFSNVSQSTQDRGVATPMQFATRICKLNIPYFNDVENNEDQTERSDPKDINLDTAMKKLGNLVKSLREVKSLHYDYDCKLSLAQFTAEDTKAIAFKLLDRIAAAELIPQTMRRYIRPYIQKNNLKLDVVLHEYIAEVVEVNTKLGVIWEPKLIAIINEIEKKETRCDATLKLMYKATRPWSPEVEALVVTELENNPENLKLSRQFQFGQLCKMLAAYGIRDSNLADLSRIEAILKHMFNTDNPSALEDALKICQYYSSLTTSYVYAMRIKFWINAGKLSECCALLRSIPTSQLKQVAQFIITWVDDTITWEPIDDEDRECHMKLTGAAVLLLNTVANRDDSFKNDALSYIRKLKYINRLQVEFGLYLSISTYDDKEHAKDVISRFYDDPGEFGISKTSDGNHEAKKKTNPDCSRLSRLAELLGLSIYETDSVIANLMKSRLGSQDIFELLRKSVIALNGNYMNNNQYQIKLIWKILNDLMTTPNDGNQFDWVKNIDELHVFASVALSTCPENYLVDYLSLSKFLRIVSNIAAQCETTDFNEDTERMDGLLHQWIEDQYQDDSLVLLSSEVFPILQSLFSLLLQEKKDGGLLQHESCSLAGRGLSYNVSDSGSVTFDIVQFTEKLHILVNMLQENNQHQLSMVAIMLGLSTCVQHCSSMHAFIPVMLTKEEEQKEIELTDTLMKMSDMILTRGAVVIKDKCAQLSSIVLSHRMVDNDLALCYLQGLPTDQGKEILNTLESRYHTKFTRAQSILKIGYNYVALRGDKDFQQQSKEHWECAFWGKKLQSLGVEVDSNVLYDLHHNSEAVESIIQSLIKHPNVDLQSITSFCESFNYDEELALSNYIEYQLTNTGKTTEHYQENIDKAIPLLSNVSKLQSILKSVLKNKTSPYDYERLIFVFNKLYEISDEEAVTRTCQSNLDLLEMLSLYERTSEPAELNLDHHLIGRNNDDGVEEDELMSDIDQNLPEPFKKRLPFHHLTKPKTASKIIGAELHCEKNTFKLSPIIAKLNLNKDQLFVKAIQNIALRELHSIKTNQNKVFDFSLVENIFNHLDHCVLMMSVGRWLARQIPRGPEKAKVVKKIVDRIAEISKTIEPGEIDTEELKKGYSAFLNNYKYVSTESFLIEHGITDEKFFTLCKEPTKLIYELYREYGDKVTFETGRLTGVPEIDVLAKKIADMNNIVLQAELTKLIFNWLSHKRSLTDDDEDSYRRTDDKVAKNEVSLENDKNLRRVIFVLASEYNSTVIKHLINFDKIHGNTSDVTKMTCVRAFQVLFTLVDSQVIQKEAKEDIEFIYEKIVTLVYLSELEKLHVSYTDETFRKCNKEGLVKGLWRNHSHKAQGVRIIADICLDYQIFDPQLWNSLLIKLHSFDMIPYLKHVLVSLSGVPALREIPSLVKMWRTIIMSPFNSVSNPLTKDEERNCLDAAQLLTRCPVILDVGLDEISNLMKETGLYTKAIYCMKLVPNRSQRQKNIKALIEDIGIEPLLTMVKMSRDQGVDDPQLDGVEEEIFNYIDENNLILTMNCSGYFDRFICHLVRLRKVNDLLVKAVTAGRLELATDVVGVYLKEHPNSTTSKLVNSAGLDKKHALLIYLQNEGLLNEIKPFLASMMKDTSSNTSISSTEFSSPVMSSSFLSTV